MKVKDIKVDNMFFTEKNGHKLLCTITECHNSVLPGVLNFIAKLDDGKTLISLCGLPDNDYLHFNCNRKEASQPDFSATTLLHPEFKTFPKIRECSLE